MLALASYIVKITSSSSTQERQMTSEMYLISDVLELRHQGGKQRLPIAEFSLRALCSIASSAGRYLTGRIGRSGLCRVQP
jgi:hypothetical protein